MKVDFTRRIPGNARLILIFTGWSCSPSLHSDLEMDGWDIAVAYDYFSFDFPADILDSYNTIYLFAWSLGVAAASASLDGNKITKAIAINGSLLPVNDHRGIPDHIFRGTSENLNPRNLEKFRLRMCGSSARYKELSDQWEDTDIEALRNTLNNFIGRDYRHSTIVWKKAYISSSDAIFPPENLKLAWDEANVPVVAINEPHIPDFHRIIKTIIPDTDKIGRRFSAAGKTYDRQAVIQKEIADHLSDLIKATNPPTRGKILEVGSGTGFLTRPVCEIFQPSSIDMVDLSGIHIEGLPCPNFIHKADAEKWIEETKGCYSAIVSSSTFQWFTDLRLFISRCCDKLEKGGLFAFTTFLTGNLYELDQLRPSLVYPTVEEIEEWLIPYFDIIRIETNDFILESENPMDLLRHLKETGVGGSAPTPEGISKLRRLKHLTYKAAYFITRKR